MLEVGWEMMQVVQDFITKQQANIGIQMMMIIETLPVVVLQMVLDLETNTMVLSEDMFIQLVQTKLVY